MNGAECKYCQKQLTEIEDEGLVCEKCSKHVHFVCLERGGTPGGLYGDIFFDFTCKFCNGDGNESFTRQRITWFQAIALSLYNLKKKNEGLSRKGFFHWKLHLMTFIDKNWDIIFKPVKKTKRWVGTIPGNLSIYNPMFFTSGTTIINEQGWWTLTYPNLTPAVLTKLQGKALSMKQKLKEEGRVLNDKEIIETILENENFKPEHLLNSFTLSKTLEESNNLPMAKSDISKLNKLKNPQKHLLPSLESICERPLKRLYKESKEKEICASSNMIDESNSKQYSEMMERKLIVGNDQKLKLSDPFCHYNTSLQNLSIISGVPLREKLLGKVREELILSPYSNIYLKPYIRRDTVTNTKWIQLLTEILLKANENDKTWKLPPRYPIDYVYVQPEHIPAINSLCSQFFWPGIDLTECLQYPDFSCVVLYGKLIVGFAFLVPNVKFNENYLSFIFTRPGWRNAGIAKFMIYHLIQMSIGKDITLHVSINNSALFLYQKFGFKVENVVLDFYDKYVRRNAGESKHAFFCRLER